MTIEQPISKVGATVIVSAEMLDYVPRHRVGPPVERILDDMVFCAMVGRDRLTCLGADWWRPWRLRWWR